MKHTLSFMEGKLISPLISNKLICQIFIPKLGFVPVEPLVS